MKLTYGMQLPGLHSKESTIKALELRPAEESIIEAMVAYMARYFHLSTQQQAVCMAFMRCYPEDLLCAAYYRVMQLAETTSCNEIITHMADTIWPEMSFRLTRHSLLEKENI